MNSEEISRRIEGDIKNRWGWLVNVEISKDGRYLRWVGNRETNEDRYDMYPGMTQEQADRQVMEELLLIIRKYIPNFVYESYTQSGNVHYSYPQF